MNKFMKNIITAATVWLVIVLILFPQNCIEAGLRGVFLCLDTVIPSLFPFFVCSGLIIGFGLARPLQKLFAPFMTPLFGVSGAGALPFVLGILSGYPVGAKCVADLYSKGYCSKSESEKLLAFCNNSGPLFILGAVGAGMAGNVALGRYLYIIHVLSAFITGIIFRFYKSEKTEVLELPAAQSDNWYKTVLDAFSGATESMITVCGFVILFSVVGAAIPKIGISPIIHGLLEITGGAEKILGMDSEFNFKVSVLSGIIAFSGLSVILQVLGIIGRTNLSPKLYLMGKAVQGAVALILGMLALRFFPVSENTAAITVTGSAELWRNSLVMAGMIVIFLVLLKKKAVDN